MLSSPLQRTRPLPLGLFFGGKEAAETALITARRNAQTKDHYIVYLKEKIVVHILGQ